MVSIGVLLLRVAGSTVAALGAQRLCRPSDFAGDRRAGLRDWRGPPGPRVFRPVVWS